MASNPQISVIVPVYNDPDGLRDTLNSLTKQKSSSRYEIIVVDNNSTDETPQVIEKFEREYPNIVYGLEETNVQSSYAARNTGIEYVSSEILAFIDADVTAEDNWIEGIVENFEETNVDYLGCNVEMYISGGEKSIWAQYDASMGLPAEHYLETKQFAPTCALAVRADVIRTVGPFDQRLVSGGDKEFGNRVDRAEFEMRFTDDTTVYHPARSNLGTHLSKAKRIGRGQVELWRYHGLANHPLSPLRYLPPSPSRVFGRARSSQNGVRFYFMSYLLKLVQSLYGTLYYARN